MRIQSEGGSRAGLVRFACGSPSVEKVDQFSQKVDQFSQYEGIPTSVTRPYNFWLWGSYLLQIPKKFELLILWILCSVYVFVQGRGYTLSSQYSLPWNVIILFIGTKWLTKWQFLTQWALSLDYLDRFRFSLGFEGGERGRRPPLPEIVRSSYRRLQ